MKVSIITTSQHRYSTGIIEEIAARNPFHEQGIMVRLTNGDVGRIQRIFLTEDQQKDKHLTEIKKILEKGENFHTEFKSSALWSIALNPVQLKDSKSFELREYGNKASKVIIAKSIAAFLNSDGGNLLIGVRENKEKGKFEIVGIEEDIKKARDHILDGYKRTLIDEIIRTFLPPKIYNHLHNYIEIEFVDIEEKIVCWIRVKRSDSRVFLKINDRDVFMIRVDSENRTLEGEKLVDYCIKKWGSH